MTRRDLLAHDDYRPTPASAADRWIAAVLIASWVIAITGIGFLAGVAAVRWSGC